MKLQRTSWRVAAAFKAIRFDAVPVQVEPEVIAELDRSGQRRGFGWLSKGKRARWIERQQKIIDRYQGELKALANSEEIELSSREWARVKELQKKLSQWTEIKNADYFGRRGLFFWGGLLSRRYSSRYLGAPADPLEQSVRGRKQNVLWMIAPLQGLIEPMFVENGVGVKESKSISLIEDGPEVVDLKNLQRDLDPIAQGLIDEHVEVFQSQASAGTRSLLEGLLKDVDSIFNAELDSATRAVLIEVFEKGLIELFAVANEEALELVGGGQGWYLPRLVNRYRLHRRGGEMIYQTIRWTDWLRSAALGRDPEKLEIHKYKSMEYLLRFFVHNHFVNLVYSSDGKVSEQNEALKQLNERLLSFRPWKRKRWHYSWRPLGIPTRAQCREISRIR